MQKRNIFWILFVIIVVSLIIWFNYDLDITSNNKTKKKVGKFLKNKDNNSQSPFGKISKEKQALSVDFEKFSPNNSYNVFVNPNLSKQKKEKRLKDLWKIQRLKAKLKTSQSLTKDEKKIYLDYSTKEIRDQIDLLRFSIEKDGSLSRDEIKQMKGKIKELNKNRENLIKLISTK